MIADYERKDSHQVTLYAGQVVHVIEKHDTGGWALIKGKCRPYTDIRWVQALQLPGTFPNAPIFGPHNSNYRLLYIIKHNFIRFSCNSKNRRLLKRIIIKNNNI